MRFLTTTITLGASLALCGKILMGQDGFPPVKWTDGAPPSVLPLWPSQGVVSVSDEAHRGFASILAKRPDFPKDSIRQVVEIKGQAWLKYLEGAPRAGLHQDAYAQVAALARNDKLALAEIDRRLSTPGLSPKDKAYTYEMAVRAFAVPGDPAATNRLPIAEKYLQGLIGMGDGTVPVIRQFNARMALVSAYYEANSPADVVRHGLAGVELLPKVPFARRGALYDAGMMNTIHELIVDALMRLPDGERKIGPMNDALRKGTIPPADSIAIDSAFYWRSTNYVRALNESMKLTGMLRQKRGAIYSNFWINTTDTSAHSVEVNDGKIRVIELGSHWCGICLMGLDGLQRVKEAFPQIETMYLTSTVGTWGNRVVTPQEESYLLVDLYKTKRKITVPIALWRQERGLNADGDRVPTGDTGEMFNRYPQLGKPQYYVLDGNGTIRKVFTTWSREIEQRIFETVRTLLREQAAGQSRQQASIQ